MERMPLATYYLLLTNYLLTTYNLLLTAYQMEQMERMLGNIGQVRMPL